MLSCVAFCMVAAVGAAESEVKTLEKDPPAEVSESIRALLQPQAIQLLQDGKPAFELWLRKEVPLKSKPAAAKEGLSAMAETTLMGALVVQTDALRDYKDNDIPKGPYTVRFGLQPKDGDHLGTADFDYFFILIAAANDKSPEAISRFKQMTQTSGKITPSGHPAVMSLRPATPEGGVPSVTEPAEEHKAIRLKVPGTAPGGEKAEIAFDFVFEGHGHIQ